VDQPYPYIYVNADGSARELHPNERTYLDTPFQGADGARPYIKSQYSQKNGWGELSGYLKRSKLPPGTQLHPAPLDDPSRPQTRQEHIEFLRGKGLDVVENSDGTFTIRKPR